MKWCSEGRDIKIRTSNSDDEIQNDQHQAFHIVRPPILDEKVNEQDGDEEHDGLCSSKMEDYQSSVNAPSHGGSRRKGMCGM